LSPENGRDLQYVIIKINFFCFVKKEMKKSLLIFLSLLFLASRPPFASALTPDIMGPDMKIIDNNIIVNISVANIPELEKTIKSGIGKELVFTAELMRVWRFWPDEFVVSKEVKKVITYDGLRDQYFASSYDGINRSEKTFIDQDTMKDWVSTAGPINLANIRELDPAEYYIRIIVESKSIEQLPLIGFLMHLVPEVEMSLAKESVPFTIWIDK